MDNLTGKVNWKDTENKITTKPFIAVIQEGTVAQGLGLLVLNVEPRLSKNKRCGATKGANIVNLRILPSELRTDFPCPYLTDSPSSIIRET